MAKISYAERRRRKKKKEREKRDRRTDAKASARKKPSMITNHVPTPRRPSRQPAQLDESLAWYGVHTVPRGEDKARKALEAEGFASYMPTEEVERVRRGKRAFKDKPYLSRYLFVGLPAKEPPFGVVHDADCVTGLLGVRGEPQRVRVGHLAQFDGALADIEAGRVRRSGAIAIGDQVRIKEGPFMGFNAVVSHVMLEAVRADVNIFGRLSPVDLPLEAVTPL